MASAGESDEELSELLRNRWARARARLGLADAGDPAFGQAGFGLHLGTPSVRLLILPRDPEAARVDFDEGFWEWWRQTRPDPAAGGSITWGGRQASSILEAAVAEVYNGEWEQYLAVHRSGGLDMGLGGAVRFNRNDRGEPQGVQLIQVVGRIWAALAAYGEVLGRYEIEGAWQVSVALVGAGNSQLGLYASGWDSARVQPADVQGDQLFWMEVKDWPHDADGVRELALRLGGVLADAWGLAAHPFLTRNGSNPGQFDREKYQRA